MLEQVLSVARTILHFSYKPYKVRMQAVYSEIDRGAFSCFHNLFLYLFAYFGRNLFDACRVDASVGNELVQG